MDLSKLDEPFEAKDIEWRAQSCGKGQKGFWVSVLAYVTNRAIMARLDAVCGKENWKNEFKESPNSKAIECGISIRIDGEWITKWDAAEETNIEAVKGGRSGAMKRAAVQWGIGRYLYDLDAGWGVIVQNGANKAKTKQGEYFSWNPPQLPAWALPKQQYKPIQHPVQQQPAVDYDSMLSKATQAMSSADMNTLQALFKQYQKDLHGAPEHLQKLIEVKDIRKSELEGNQ